MSTPERDLEQYERENERADELENYQDFISDLEDLTNSLTHMMDSAPTPELKGAVEKMHAHAHALLDAAIEYIS